MGNTIEKSSVINFPAMAKQIIDFGGLRFGGNKMPTDIDGFYEYKNKAFILIEVKYKGVVPPLGQVLALTRAADAFEKAGKMGIVLFCWHNVANPEKNIDAASANVQYIYRKGQWYKGSGNLRQIIEYCISLVEAGRNA